ncbi:urease accessory protein UreD, partial [Klebsiella pneumoniae]|uniref:urease accessory protein UreD n=1 Tax=Klebsiella pneumoniae TaxID=573 RepID=UPI001BAD2169
RYRTNGKQAFQHIYLNVKDDSILVWMPQETIPFDGASAHSETDIHLEQTASFIGWDMLILGRQARAENFVQGS